MAVKPRGMAVAAASARRRLNLPIKMGIQSTGFRTVPDVAMDAAPQTGVPVYDSFDGYQWVKVGGTSVATPLFAALMTVENSLRIANGGGVIMHPLPDLYRFISLAATAATSMT